MNLSKIQIFLGTLATISGSVCAQAPPSAYASLQVPTQIQYQGRISTAAGGAWDGDGYFLFAIYQGTTPIWNNWEGKAESVADPETVESPGSNEVFEWAVKNGLYSLRLGDEGVSAKNKKIPAMVFIDKDSGAVRTGLKLAVWFSPDGTWTRKPGDTPGSPTKSANRLSPDVEFTSVPFAIAAGMAETVKKRSVTNEMLADNAVASVNIADGTLVAADLSAPVAQALVPPGTILPYGGTTPPVGFLMCDGSSHLKSLYPALAAVLNNGASGAAFGGSTTHFNVPDLRGRFLRGTDDPDGAGTGFAAAGRDPNVSATDRPRMNPGGNPGNAVGSIQLDAFQGHWHQVRTTDGYYQYTQDNSVTPGGNGYTFMDRDSRPAFDKNRAATILTDGTNGTPRISSETRPLNANVNYIIKF